MARRLKHGKSAKKRYSPPALKAEKEFKKFKEGSRAKADVVEKLKRAFLSYSGLDKKNELDVHGLYREMKNSDYIRNVAYSAKDIENLSVALAELQREPNFSERAGVFLSLLINNGRDNNYIVDTSKWDGGPDFLGLYNTKNIIVKGNVGEYLGKFMEKGHIRVEGNALDFVGLYMRGGTITIEGEIKDFAGSDMRDGIIEIREDAGGAVGHGMRGGEIHIEGRYETLNINFVCSGKIYHKGKLIVDK